MTRVTVVVPAFNEGASFGARLASLTDALSIYRAGGYVFEYLVVDDGSTDDTAAIARDFAETRECFRVASHERNRGLGAALRTAIPLVGTEFTVMLDADLSYAPATAMQLLEELERKDADVALASPYMRGGMVRNVPPVRRYLSREANRLLSLATSGRYATLTSMVRAFRTRALREIAFQSDGMDAIVEMAFDAMRKQLRIVEVPALLEWSEERAAAGNRLRASRALKQIGSTLRLAFEFRPSLWLAVPGLIPGLLPLVVAVLLVLHSSATVLAAVTLGTIVVQYVSLAIFAGQLSIFIKRTSIHPFARPRG